jgi:iron(II)-dependent oxidoreductase
LPPSSCLLHEMSSPADSLAERLTTTRKRTLALYEPLAGGDIARTPDPVMSPPLWDLGHIAAYEELWLACRLTGHTSLHPELQQAYDAFETPRARRTSIRLLNERECRDYLDRVRERSLEALAVVDLDPDGPPLTADGFVFEMVAEHEAQHTETVLQTLQMFGDGTYRPPRRRHLPDAAQTAPDRIFVPPGSFAMGAGGDFAYDCERPRHPRVLAGYLIDRHPVTNGRHLEFMADGGYRRPELWSAEGWTWRCEHDVRAPLYWEPDTGGGWLSRSFDEVAPVDPDRPVCHVSWHEAAAHARWAGARLPTEEEWERAACSGHAGCDAPRFPWGDAPAEDRANLDQLAFGPAPVGAYPAGAAPTGCAQLIGDVWEWTASAFGPYPGFAAFPYREYSEVFFGKDYRVLRGGSWATQPIAVRTTFRNWDLPQRRQVFAGFRLAWDLDDRS